MAVAQKESANESLVLYYYPECPYCQTVLHAIDRLDARGAIQFRNIRADEDAWQTLDTIGGKQQVPCLFIEGNPLYESADIVEWLKARFA